MLLAIYSVNILLYKMYEIAMTTLNHMYEYIMLHSKKVNGNQTHFSYQSKDFPIYDGVSRAPFGFDTCFSKVTIFLQHSLMALL